METKSQSTASQSPAAEQSRSQAAKAKPAEPAAASGGVRSGSFDIGVECGKCGAVIESKNQQELLKFEFCKCDNKARLCVQNHREGAHLIGAEDESNTFVHVRIGANGTITLPKMTLVKWNQLQHRFKTHGTLNPTTKTKPP